MDHISTAKLDAKRIARNEKLRENYSPLSVEEKELRKQKRRDAYKKRKAASDFAVPSGCMAGPVMPSEENMAQNLSNRVIEIPVGGIHMDSILSQSSLPLKYVAFSHCFHTEADAAGTVTRTLDMASEDLGAPAYRKFDVEAWMLRFRTLW